jgi:hypothetical protein
MLLESTASDLAKLDQRNNSINGHRSINEDNSITQRNESLKVATQMMTRNRSEERATRP